MEAQAQDLDKEVDGVAGHSLLRPAPIAFFEDQTGEGGQGKIARLPFDEWEVAFLQQGPERGLARRADFARGFYLGEGLVTVLPPVELNQDAVDLLEVHDAGLAAEGDGDTAMRTLSGLGLCADGPGLRQKRRHALRAIETGMRTISSDA